MGAFTNSFSRGFGVQQGAWMRFDGLAPSGLILTVISGTSIKLEWTNNSINAEGVSIERSFDGISYNEITTVLSNVSTYTDTGLTQSTVYYYRLRSYKRTLYSLYSNAKFQLTFASALLSADTGWYSLDDLSTITKDGNNYISELRDKNGQLPNLIPINTWYPLWTSNGMKSVPYAADRCGILTAAFTLNQPCELFVSAMLPTWANNTFFIYGGGAGTFGLRQSTSSPNIASTASYSGYLVNMPLNEYHVVHSYFTPGFQGDFTEVDGANGGIGDGGNTNPGGLTIGGKNDGLGIRNAIYRDVVISKVLLSAQDRAAINEYLIKKNAFFF